MEPTAQRDALEAELFALAQAIQTRWQRSCAAPAELLARVEVLLDRLKLVNRILSEPGDAAPA